MSKKITRRSFLQGIAAGAAGLMAGGIMQGCAEPQVNETTASVAAPEKEIITETVTVIQEVVKPQYEVINTDMIIVGSGNGAMAAAFWAIQNGKKVTIIDKGPYGHSGVSGMNWDCYGTYKVASDIKYMCVDPSNQMINANLINAATITHPKHNIPLDFLNRGEILPSRNEDGSQTWYFELNVPDVFDIYFVDSLHFRLDTDGLRRSPMVTVVDRTMVTDVVIDNGKCVGVSAIYLPTGDYRVFRAPITILATGGCTQHFGWNGVAAKSISSTDVTGDVDMALFRRGAKIGHSEFNAFDFVTCYPRALGYGWGTCMDCDGNEPHNISDKNGKPFYNNGPADIYTTLDRCYFDVSIAKAIMEGDVLAEDGHLRYNINNGPIRKTFEYNLKVFENFGIDPYKELIPASWNMFEHMGLPVVGDDFMTEYPGLIHQRGAGSVDPSGQSSCGSNQLMGLYAAQCAMNYVDKMEPVTSIDYTSAENEFARLQEILDRKAEDPLRPHEVRHAIQEVCDKALGLIRYKADLEAAVKELARIRGEDLPRMCVSNKSRTYNTEWKDAIEVYNLMDEAELSVKATLLREETRGQYLYVDFPEKDDENWNCMLVAQKQGDEVVFTKEYPNS